MNWELSVVTESQEAREGIHEMGEMGLLTMEELQ